MSKCSYRHKHTPSKFQCLFLDTFCKSWPPDHFHIISLRYKCMAFCTRPNVAREQNPGQGLHEHVNERSLTICLSLHLSVCLRNACMHKQASAACHSKLLGKHGEGKTKLHTVLNEEFCVCVCMHACVCVCDDLTMLIVCKL